jgi:hypothetical protein
MLQRLILYDAKPSTDDLESKFDEAAEMIDVPGARPAALAVDAAGTVSPRFRPTWRPGRRTRRPQGSTGSGDGTTERLCCGENLSTGDA